MLSPRILIVGGGIAGLALATALRRRGLNAELVERETQWKPAGGGIAVQPNAMRVLHELGIGATVDRGKPPILPRCYMGDISGLPHLLIFKAACRPGEAPHKGQVRGVN